MTSRPRALGTLLSDGSNRLVSLATESKSRVALRERVRGCLPAAFAPQCSHAELEAGVLIVSVDNAAAATLLRYQLAELQTRLAKQGLPCDRIRVQVLPAVRLAAAPARTARVFEESVRQRLASTAASLEDGALRRSLQKLARHRGKPR